MPSPWPDAGLDVLLADGSTAYVRSVRREDAGGLSALFSGLSDRSVVLRFFGPHHPSQSEIERMTNLSGADAAALVVERSGVIVAVAEYDRAPGRDEAEVAFVVADSFQGRGIGTLLLEFLADLARAHGIKRFVADTLSENHKMIAVLREAGFARQYERSAEVLRVVLDIAPSPEAIAAAEERDRHAVLMSMQRLLRPRSIAVVGASRRSGTIGHELVRNLVNGGFAGRVYPVNPGADAVASLPCWPGVEAVPGAVDLAVIAVPAAAVADVVESCGRKGVGGLVVISAGFAEIGPEGADTQHSLARLAHGYGMRLIGPNCFGVINTEPSVSMNATFAADAPFAGKLGFASQSGGLGIAILAEARSRGLGLSSFVSMGNKADVSGNDLLVWWEEDDATDVLLLYLESFGNPRKFSRIARRVGMTKPIVAVKGGRTAAGSRAASSHTAALASPERVVDALFHQTGVIHVDTVEELFDVGAVLAHQPVPDGVRTAIVGNAGGPGVLAADTCVGHGLDVPELSVATQASLRELLPAGAGVRNPVDMTAAASSDTYRRALEAVFNSGEVDAVLVVFTAPLVTRAEDVADAVVAAVDSGAGSVTTVAAFIGSALARPRLQLAKRPVPCYTYPESAARALAHAASYGRWRSRPQGVLPVLDRTDSNEARRLLAPTGQDWLTGAHAMAVLAAYGVPVLPVVTVDDASGAAAAARAMDGPVALKALGPSIVHKTDIGGVRLNLVGGQAAREAFVAMQQQVGDAMEGAVLQPMAPAGVETIAGIVQDPAFGPVVLFGAGGTSVELLGDSVTRLAPLTDADAWEMVLGLRTAPLLTGYRGSVPVDIDALVDLVLRIGRLAEDLPEVAELDCNPVVAHSSGAVVVDARIRVSAEPVPTVDGPRHLR